MIFNYFLTLCLCFMLGCSPKKDKPQTLVCKDPNDPQSCPSKKLALARQSCQDTLGAQWSDVEKKCALPSSHTDCEKAAPDGIWNGAGCSHVADEKTFYLLCTDTSQIDSVKRTIYSIMQSLGSKTCQNAYDKLIASPKLEANGLQIIDVSPIATLKHLKELNLWHNQISDPSPLTKLDNLEILNLGKNRLTDITSLASMRKLKRLFLFENQISNATPLSAMTHLTLLDISRNLIEDLSPLANLQPKEGLFSEGNPFSKRELPIHEENAVKIVDPVKEEVSSPQKQPLEDNLENADSVNLPKELPF